MVTIPHTNVQITQSTWTATNKSSQSIYNMYKISKQSNYVDWSPINYNIWIYIYTFTIYNYIHGQTTLAYSYIHPVKLRWPNTPPKRSILSPMPFHDVILMTWSKVFFLTWQLWWQLLTLKECTRWLPPVFSCWWGMSIWVRWWHFHSLVRCSPLSPISCTGSQATLPLLISQFSWCGLLWV